ncbi:MAG: oligosaccharide repeat unit polymerase [Alteromonadaceae bacterium]|nr:oligosaccharide repeat unit polymerase [Alteromonadaceae bacterium]
MVMNGVFRVLSLYGICAAVFSFLFHPGDNNWMLFGGGQLAFTALLGLPSVMSRKIKITDPLVFLTVPVTVGTVLGSLMIAFGDSRRRTYVMAEWDVGDFAQGMVFMLLSLTLISIGYCATRRRIKLENILPSTRHISQRGIQVGLMIGVAISILSIMSYVQSTGGISLSAISKKRAVEIASEGEVVYAGAGYIRMLIGISDYLLLILMAYYLKQSPRLKLSVKVQLVAVFLLAAFLPFISSGRGALVGIFYGLLYVYVAYRDIRWSQMIAIAMVPLIIFGVMTGLRSEAQGRADEGGFVNPLIALPESGNGLAITSTTAVLNSVPERMPYQMGGTLVSWVFAPIPRSIWPQKPDVSLGKRIKAEIYQRPVLRTGNPASFMAEGFMNFGLVGFLLCSLALGSLARLTANSFEAVMQSSILAPVLYYTTSISIAGLTNSNFSQGFVRYIADVISCLIAYMLLRYIIARRSSGQKLIGQQVA